MKVKDIETIDVNAKEWFDRINGNSYFSSIVTINFGMFNQVLLKLPFQYGYGSHYQDQAMKAIADYLREQNGEEINGPLWHFCKNNGIILRTNKVERCLKRECLQFVA